MYAAACTDQRFFSHSADGLRPGFFQSMVGRPRFLHAVDGAPSTRFPGVCQSWERWVDRTRTPLPSGAAPGRTSFHHASVLARMIPVASLRLWFHRTTSGSFRIHSPIAISWVSCRGSGSRGLHLIQQALLNAVVDGCADGGVGGFRRFGDPHQVLTCPLRATSLVGPAKIGGA